MLPAVAPAGQFDAVVVELGTNDVTETDPAQFERDYAQFLYAVRDASPDAVLLCAGLLLGVGFANFQSVGQAVSLSLVSRSRYAQATTTFYIFFDLGIGLGPYIFGHLIPSMGYSGMYLALSIVVLASIGIYRLVHGGRTR